MRSPSTDNRPLSGADIDIELPKSEIARRLPLFSLAAWASLLVPFLTALFVLYNAKSDWFQAVTIQLGVDGLVIILSSCVLGAFLSLVGLGGIRSQGAGGVFASVVMALLGLAANGCVAMIAAFFLALKGLPRC